MTQLESIAIIEYLIERRANVIKEAQTLSRLLDKESPVLTRAEIRALCAYFRVSSLKELRMRLNPVDVTTDVNIIKDRIE